MILAKCVDAAVGGGGGGGVSYFSKIKEHIERIRKSDHISKREKHSFLLVNCVLIDSDYWFSAFCFQKCN